LNYIKNTLQITIYKPFPSSPTKEIKVNVKITLVFTRFPQGSRGGNVVGQWSHGLKKVENHWVNPL
jgi:hypothetical protein